MAAMAKKIAPAQAVTGVNQIAALVLAAQHEEPDQARAERGQMHAFEPQAHSACDSGGGDDDAKADARRAHHADLHAKRQQWRWS